MNALKELDELLSIDHNVNAWSDHFILEATEKIGQLSPEELNKIQSEWAQKSPHWQRQFADAAAGVQSTYEILKQMLSSSKGEVLISVLNSLDLFEESVSADSGLRNALKELSEKFQTGELVLEDADRSVFEHSLKQLVDRATEV